ncbi:MAG TPA: hypothetical protein VF013_01030 [Candidatus Limnocylindria bacterium]
MTSPIEPTPELKHIRDLRRQRVEKMLHDELLRQAPGNAVYWIAVVGGSFVLNLLVLVLIAR